MNRPRRVLLACLSAVVAAIYLGTDPAAAVRPSAPGSAGSPMPANYSTHVVRNVHTASGSCSGYYSDTTPPSTIRVYRRSLGRIDHVSFKSYVENSLPDEWVASWRAASLQAGAMAIKSYSWYWVNHWRGGSYNGACYDVDDSTNYLVYVPGSAQPSTTAAVDATWDTVMTKSGSIFEASFCSDMNCAEPPANESCGENSNGVKMSQVGTEACAVAGENFEQIVGEYYYPHLGFSSTSVSSGSSVFVPSNGSYHVFWTGAGGHLMQTYYLSDGWHTQDLGGVIAGAPGVTYHDGRYDVFAVSPGGHLFQRTYSGSWGAWRNLGGSWSAGVSAVYVAASNNYHVFGHYPSGHLQQYYWSGSWHRQDLGGVTAGTPGVSYHNGRYDVFAVSPGGHLFQRTYSGGWGAWHQIGSAAYHPGVGAVYTGTSYHVFLRSSDDHMAQVYYNSTGWHGPQHLGGTFGNGPGVTYHGGRYDLFGPAGGGIYQSTYTGHWSAWHKVSA